MAIWTLRKAKGTDGSFAGVCIPQTLSIENFDRCATSSFIQCANTFCMGCVEGSSCVCSNKVNCPTAGKYHHEEEKRSTIQRRRHIVRQASDIRPQASRAHKPGMNPVYEDPMLQRRRPEKQVSVSERSTVVRR